MKNFWEINSEAEFEAAALELFRFQAERLAPYRRYLELIECRTELVDRVEKIPFLPIELFKSCEIYSHEAPPEAIFTSSGALSSRHFMHSLQNYEEAFVRSFELFYGAVSQWSIYALLPSYLEREGSSLIYMVDRMISLNERGCGGFYLYDHKRLLADIAQDGGRKILLGVSYALLDLAESALVGGEELKDVVVMETGGMKGQRAELSKRELHSSLTKAFGVERIESEYGMAELTSQGYSRGEGRFYAPAWMRVLIRDLNDPFDLRCAEGRGGAQGAQAELRGGVNIIDLASKYSCAFIQTQDLGRLFADGSFEIEGRISGSDVRGCNLLVQ